ncbi:hypothetical protein NW768_003135 [Fusarium equiseti]|uniref:Uncharacterized protein n=1 Tax=Fusarium equiseti TaxID=61235 RepID=A0ABQ8RL95_FUSEQ|nr:hypothetical protein NW768_003135 [Fusarium equiseti]
MFSLSSYRFAYFLILAAVFNSVLANVEKTIFTAPALLPIPQQKPSLADLRLPILTPDTSEIRTNLSRVFPPKAKDYASGAATWVLLDDLKPDQRYEFRVCWAAIQPTGFVLDVFELDTVWETPELIQSLADYASSRQGDGTELNEESPRPGEKERKASLLLLRIKASADYFTDKKSLMKNPPPVLVDLILDPYLLNVIPRSLFPTAGYIAVIAVASWFLSRSIATKLKAVAITTDDADKKEN